MDMSYPFLLKEKSPGIRDRCLPVPAGKRGPYYYMSEPLLLSYLRIEEHRIAYQNRWQAEAPGTAGPGLFSGSEEEPEGTAGFTFE